MWTTGIGGLRRRAGYGGLTPLLPVRARLLSLPPEAGLGLVVLFWGFNFAVVKVPLEVMPPFVVNAIRFAISACVLGAIHVTASRAAGRSPLATFRVGVWPVVGLGVLGHALYQVGFILGIARTTAGGAALLIALSPLVTAAAGHVLGVDRMARIGWIGALVSLAGVVLVVLGRPGELGGDLTGVLLLLGASVAWGLATALSRPLLARGATPVGLAFWGVMTALPVLTALALTQLDDLRWADVDRWDWLALLYSGSLSTGVAYWIWNSSVQKVGPSRTAAFSNLVPFVGVAAGAVLLGEPIVALQVLGGALIVAGVVVVRRAPSAPAAPSTAPPLPRT